MAHDDDDALNKLCSLEMLSVSLTIYTITSAEIEIHKQTNLKNIHPDKKAHTHSHTNTPKMRVNKIPAESTHSQIQL